jgi:hypothetical protein
MAEGLHVEGLREVVRDLQKAGVEIDDLKDAFAALAAEGASFSRGQIDSKSGKLAGSARGNRAKGKAMVTWGRATVPYAGAQNYGWPARNISAQNFTGATDAHMEPRAVSRFEDEIEDVLRRRGLV